MPACAVTSVNCMGPDERTGERGLARCCTFFSNVSVLAVVGTSVAGEILASVILWVTEAAGAMTAKLSAPVLQPAAAAITEKKKDNFKMWVRVRNSSRGNGGTGSTCPSRIQPHLDQHGRRANDK